MIDNVKEGVFVKFQFMTFIFSMLLIPGENLEIWTLFMYNGQFQMV